MSTHDAPELETIGHKTLLGIDAQGREHRWCMVRQTAYVLDDGQLAHAEHVGDRSLVEWVDYIAEYVGWDVLHYSPGPFAGIEVGE